MDITLELQILLFRIRAQIQDAVERSTEWGEAEFRNHQNVFIQMRKWFPFSKVREIRLGILEAFCGFPIDSQRDLNYRIINVLKEVLKDDSRYLTTQLCTELSDAVEGSPHGTAWNLSAAEPESMAVSDLQSPDLSSSKDGST